MENRKIVLVGISYDLYSIVSGSQRALENVLGLFGKIGWATTIQSTFSLNKIRQEFPGHEIVVITQQWAAQVARRDVRNESENIPVITYAHGPNQIVADFNLFMTCSDNVKNDTLEKFPYLRNNPRLLVMRPPISLSRNFIPLTENRKYITMSGIYAQKGHRIVIEIAKQMPQESFLIVCDKNEKGEFKILEYANDKDENQFLNLTTDIQTLPSNVFCTEPSKNIIDDIFSKSKIVLMPSRYESYGMFPIEASYCGIPCICSDVPGMRDALCDQEKSMYWIQNRSDISSWVSAIQNVQWSSNARELKIVDAHEKRQVLEFENLKESIYQVLDEKKLALSISRFVCQYANINVKANPYIQYHPIKDIVPESNLWQMISYANTMYNKNPILKNVLFISDHVHVDPCAFNFRNMRECGYLKSYARDARNYMFRNWNQNEKISGLMFTLPISIQGIIPKMSRFQLSPEQEDLYSQIYPKLNRYNMNSISESDIDDLNQIFGYSIHDRSDEFILLKN